MANEIKYGPAVGPEGPEGPPGPPGTAVTGGRTFYLSNQGGTPPDYEGLALLPDGAPEDTMEAVGITSLDGEVALQGPDAPSVWVTEVGVPGVETVDAGVWTAKLFASADAGNGASRIRFKLYKATADLVSETLLLTFPDSAALPTTSSAAIDIEVTASAFDVAATDRLILRAYAVTASTTPVDVTLYHSGTTRYTRLLSPIVAATVYSDLLPLSGGTASAGAQNVAARGDHRHAHGVIEGGDTHALAVANVSHGYLSSTDKAKLDGVESGAQAVSFARVQTALSAASSPVAFNGQKISSLGAPADLTDADTLGARNAAVAAAFAPAEDVSGASPATTAQTILDVVFSYRVVSNAVVELAGYTMPPTGASVAIFVDLEAFTEGTHANQMVHVIVGSGKRTSAGVSSRTSPAGGGGSGQVVNDFAVTRPAVSVSDPSSAVAPNVQHRLAVLYTGKAGVNTIVTGTARIVIGRVS